MKKYFYFFSFILIFQISCNSSAQQQMPQQTKAERKPFQKSPHVIKQVTEHPQRELDDSKSYDPNPRVVVVDEKAGKYEFSWIGYDGKEKIVAYQRHDAIDAVVKARVEKTQDGKFIYKYDFTILSTSPTYFRKFIVQTFAGDTKPISLDNNLFNIGQMTNLISIFKDGVWWSFGFIGEEKDRFQKGSNIEFQLISISSPGLVNCRALGAELGVMGVGEDMPSVLEDKIPIFEDLASGYTIGPVEKLSGLSKAEKAKYLLDNLPKFQEAGWMGEATAKKYESILKKEDLTMAFEQARKDLKNEFITSEVFHIIEGLQKQL